MRGPQGASHKRRQPDGTQPDPHSIHFAQEKPTNNLESVSLPIWCEIPQLAKIFAKKNYRNAFFSMRLFLQFLNVLLFIAGFRLVCSASTIYASAGAWVYTDLSTLNPSGWTWDTAQPWPAAVTSTVTSGSSTATAQNNGPGIGIYRGVQGSSFASSNLSHGQLRALQYSALDVDASAANIRSEARASFGDEFSISSPSGPYSWTSSSKVRFSFDVSGFIDNQSQLSFMTLFFYYGRPGALANSSTGLPVPGKGFLSEDFCSFQIGRNQNLLGLTTCGGSIAMDQSGNVGGAVFAEFSPGGDFDWLVSLNVYGWPGSFGSGPGSAIADFRNTINVTYQGPPDSITYSSSGVFPGTFPAAEAVPEPSTWTTIALGCAAMVLRLRFRNTR
jgi:hypothetical protein